MWLLVGLGNPGREYEDTRHNAGFRVLDALAVRARASGFKDKMGAQIAEGRAGSERILLCKPMEFMNVSGQAVVRVAQFWKVEPARTVVVHDDLDIAFGRLKLGAGGGHGGHNGLRSILGEWGQADFHRVRFGIGRPPAGRDPVGYVLATFTAEEHRELPALCDLAAQAAACIVTDGLTVAMNRFNTKSSSNRDKQDNGGGSGPKAGTS